MNPKIPRRWLFLISGSVWMLVGGLLCGRAVGWLVVYPVAVESLLLFLSLIIAGGAYYFGFSKIVGRNIGRIEQMPDSASIFSFTAPKGYVLIAIMMGSGIALRNSPIPKIYLALPYFAMGSVLLIGSVVFYKTFSEHKKLRSAGAPGDNR